MHTRDPVSGGIQKPMQSKKLANSLQSKAWRRPPPWRLRVFFIGRQRRDAGAAPRVALLPKSTRRSRRVDIFAVAFRRRLCTVRLLGASRAMNINQFVQAYVESVDQLRVLLALQKDPSAEWDAVDLGAKLYLPPAVAAAALARLEANGLCASSGEPRRYRYRPKTDELSRLMEELATFRSPAAGYVDQPVICPAHRRSGICRGVQIAQRKGKLRWPQPFTCCVREPRFCAARSCGAATEGAGRRCCSGVASALGRWPPTTCCSLATAYCCRIST